MNEHMQDELIESIRDALASVENRLEDIRAYANHAIDAVHRCDLPEAAAGVGAAALIDSGGEGEFDAVYETLCAIAQAEETAAEDALESIAHYDET